MMRLRRPWWVVLAAMTLVLASLLAPMEAAAYVIDEVADPVAKGDPDNPASGRNEPNSSIASPVPTRISVSVAVSPGVLLTVRFNLPSFVSRRITRTRR